MGKGVIYISYGKMSMNLIKKYGLDSKIVLTFRLMWTSYRYAQNKNRVSYSDIEEYYNHYMNPKIGKRVDK